jgi:hypothetical protein
MGIRRSGARVGVGVDTAGCSSGCFSTGFSTCLLQPEKSNNVTMIQSLIKNPSKELMTERPLCK